MPIMPTPPIPIQSSTSIALGFDELIPQTGLTPRHVLRRLDECAMPEWKEFLSKNTKNQVPYNEVIEECHVEPIAAVGYLSKIWRLRFLAFSNEKRMEFRAIFKSPNPKYVAEVNLIKDREEGFPVSLLVQFHNREVHFYSHLVPKYLSTFASHYLPRPFAWVAADSVQGLEQAFLLLEDLSERGKPPKEPDNLSKEQVESLLIAMAQLHSDSLSIPPNEIQSLWLQETHLFKYPPSKVMERLCAPENVGCSEFFQTNRAALGNFVQQVLEESKSPGNKLKICTEFGIPPVLSHGDLWSSNLLFQNDNPNELMAMLDWQFTHPDSGLNDLAHLLLGSVDIELKRTHQAEWIRLYHSERTKHDPQALACPPPSADEMGRIFAKHLPREIYFQMQMLVLNEAAGEPKENARRRQNRIKEMFKDFLTDNQN